MTEQNKQKTENQPESNDADKALNKKIEQKVESADDKWEEVKDKTSGVNKELEKKLADGTVDPEDLSTQGG
ncbi:MAG: hypothetical protein BGN92_03965 [Sphingobacteriales bacterium 41-5]|nr:MAG: hypothetical protein ABS67_01065 [Niabella sp. SCN 42-15]OJU28266.1 MAG: hypothetical protein BGN92_03965 [Sphingobacteriales bacterium 41-5]